jgi:hypothetical protein
MKMLIEEIKGADEEEKKIQANKAKSASETSLRSAGE